MRDSKEYMTWYKIYMQSRRANDELQEQLREESAQGEYDETHDDDKRFMIQLKSNSAATAGRRKLWKERQNQKRVTFAECTRSGSLGGYPLMRRLSKLHRICQTGKGHVA